MSTELLLELSVILAAINVVLCGLVLVFGFRSPKPEPEFKPLDFDWKVEGF